MGAAVRVESLADQGLLTPAEAGGLSAELADCLKLHRQYMAAITAHAAVSMADCARAFECDRQLAHVWRVSWRTVGRRSQAAALPPPPPSQLSSPPLADDPAVCQHSVLQLDDIERTLGGAMPSSSRPPQPAAATTTSVDDEIPPWPWDPLPGDSVEPVKPQ